MTVLDQERTAAMWTIAAILSYMADLVLPVVVLLSIQALISIIASIILSYKHYGTKKPTASKRTRNRKR